MVAGFFERSVNIYFFGSIVLAISGFITSRNEQLGLASKRISYWIFFAAIIIAVGSIISSAQDQNQKNAIQALVGAANKLSSKNITICNQIKGLQKLNIAATNQLTKITAGVSKLTTANSNLTKKADSLIKNLVKVTNSIDKRASMQKR